MPLDEPLTARVEVRLGKKRGFVALLLIAGAAAHAQSRSIAIEKVSVVDVERGTIVPGQTVLVAGDRITAIGPSASVNAPSESQRVDGAGKFLIPGLWDAHVHVVGWGPAERILLPLLVANGVTSVRDMFGELSAADATRRSVLQGTVVGPRIISAGHILDGQPPVWPGSVSVANADEARHAVDSLAAHGAPFIKVYSRLTEEELRAIADEAKRRHVPFAGHVPTLMSAADASDLGQASVEHLTGVLSGCSTVEAEVLGELRSAVASRGWDAANAVGRREANRVLEHFDAARCTELGKRFARNGTWMVPTTTVLHSVAYLDDPKLGDDPRMKYAPRFQRQRWDPRTDFRFRMLTPADWAIRKRAYDKQLATIRLLHDAGAQFLAGTDLGNPYTFAGFSLHEELARLVESGLSPAEALRAATIGPATFMHIADSVGTVEKGKVADLVLLDADPLADIHNTTRISAVVLRGRLLQRRDLDGLLSSAERLARR